MKLLQVNLTADQTNLIEGRAMALKRTKASIIREMIDREMQSVGVQGVPHQGVQGVPHQGVN